MAEQMPLPELFILSEAVINGVVDHIDDSKWDMDMPPEFVTRSEDKLTLKDVVNYLAYDDAWVPFTLTGKTMDEVGADKFKGDLLGDDPKGNFAAIVEKSVAAVRTVAEEDLDRTAHLSFGDFTVGEYLLQITTFRGFRAYDISEVLLMPTDLPEALVQGMYEHLLPVAEQWRGWGVFGPEIKVPEDAPLQDRLLGLAGRTPEGDY